MKSPLIYLLRLLHIITNMPTFTAGMASWIMLFCLQVLDISRCDGLSLSALISIIKGHSDLLQLHASYCFFVSRFPVELCPKLLWSSLDSKEM